ERADRDRPADPPERVEDGEPAPLHVAGARHPGGRHAQHREPAPEEHRLAAVAAEVHLASLDGAPHAMGEAPGPGDDAAEEMAADQVADVVADDRAGGGDDPDE